MKLREILPVSRRFNRHETEYSRLWPEYIYVQGQRWFFHA